MNYPSVAIGICAKNDQKTIGKALESLLALDYSKNLLEVILIDGLSVDKTMAIVKNLVVKSKLKFMILSDSGLGIGYARKLVVENSSSELIAFVDADQYLHPRWLKEAIKELVINPKIGAVKGITGLTPSTSTPARLEAYERFYWDSKAPFHLDIWNFAIGGCLLRKSAIVDAGSFNPKITSVGEDTDLAFRMAKKGWKFRNSPLAVFYHQPRPTWKALFEQQRGYAVSTHFWGKKYRQYKTKKRLLFDVICSCLFQTGNVVRIFGFTRDLRCILLPVKHLYTEFVYFLTFALR